MNKMKSKHSLKSTKKVIDTAPSSLRILTECSKDRMADVFSYKSCDLSSGGEG